MAEEISLKGWSLVYVLAYVTSTILSLKLSSLYVLLFIHPPEKHLPFLVGLKELATIWRHIGQHLGVPVSRLDIIQENNAGNVDRVLKCLEGMFIWWLRNGEDVTVRKLIKAVHDVDAHQVEVEIRKEFGKALDSIFILNPAEFSVRLKYVYIEHILFRNSVFFL